jgi:ParB family chromosome partitioning protein
LDDPAAVARKAVARGLSVREVEKLARSGGMPGSGGGRKRPGGAKDADTLALEGDLSAALGMPVSIEHDTDRGNGKLVIKYKDLAGLDDLIRVLNAV